MADETTKTTATGEGGMLEAWAARHLAGYLADMLVGVTAVDDDGRELTEDEKREILRRVNEE